MIPCCAWSCGAMGSWVPACCSCPEVSPLTAWSNPEPGLVWSCFLQDAVCVCAAPALCSTCFRQGSPLKRELRISAAQDEMDLWAESSSWEPPALHLWLLHPVPSTLAQSTPSSPTPACCSTAGSCTMKPWPFDQFPCSNQDYTTCRKGNSSALSQQLPQCSSFAP